MSDPDCAMQVLVLNSNFSVSDLDTKVFDNHFHERTHTILLFHFTC